MLSVPAASLLAPCPLSRAGEDVTWPGEHHCIPEQEPAPILPVQHAANIPGRICPSLLLPASAEGQGEGHGSRVLTLAHHMHEAFGWLEQVPSLGGVCSRGAASGASAGPGSCAQGAESPLPLWFPSPSPRAGGCCQLPRLACSFWSCAELLLLPGGYLSWFGLPTGDGRWQSCSCRKG